ncbi:MAG TPA: hypothetical protein VN699_02420 [Pirellulales bacterium]|nr:hypothetical protein [Pirellulales bacterium]
MPRNRLFWSSLWLLGCLAGCGAQRTPDEAAAIAMIERLGGKIKFADDRTGRPVVEVALGGTAVSDADLEQLGCFTDLENLSLFDSGVGDAGIPHLTPLANLKTLYLGRTKITDAGLAAIGELPQLKTLGLSDTDVTDAGLLRLASLSRLVSINLRRTRTNDAGVRKLKESLPQLIVHR